MKSQSISILTFNFSLAPFLWHPYARIDLFSKECQRLKPDVINLQEVHTYDMVYTLRKKLTEFPYISYKAGLIGPESGLVTFSTRPIKDFSFESIGSRKGVLVSHVGDNTAVFNTHLLANTDGDWSVENRFYKDQKKQLDRLGSLLEVRLTDGSVPLLSGDFNIAKTSELYRYFIETYGWTDTSLNDFTPTFHADFLPKGRMPQRIDYIFAKNTRGFVGASTIFMEKIDGLFLSNHAGLFVEFKNK